MSTGHIRRAKPSIQKDEGINYGELAESTGFLLRRAQLSVLADLIDGLQPLDLKPAQFSVLAIIDANPDRAQSDLCAPLGIQRPNFVAMLDELESRGLTKRCVSRHDRRIRTVALTAAGERVLKQAVSVHNSHEQRLLERLGVKGRAQFERLLQRLITAEQA